MASSLNQCFVRYESGAYPVGNSPTDASLMRDAFSENVCHLADEMTQPRVQWSALTGQYISSGDAVDTLSKIASWGPFPVTMRPDGSTSWLVVRINALLATAGTHILYAVLSDGSRSGWSSALSLNGPSKQTYSMSSTSAAWLTPAVGSEQYVYATPGEASALLAPVPSPGATSGANLAAANIYMATLTLVAYQSTANVIRINAVSAREYIGT